MPFGIDPFWDMVRIARRRGFQIERAFDVGAHIGQTATEMRRVFAQARIDSFEPHPDSYACLAKLADVNLTTHRLAISNRCGEAPFFVRSEPTNRPVAASMNNSLVADTQFGLVAGRHTRSITVERTTIDCFCDANAVDRLDLLKIDTEGHEAEVLDGARETLAHRGVRLVFLEFETILPIVGATGGALAPCAQILEGAGFRLMATYVINQVDAPLYAAFNALYLSPR
jgi:FkbM family methyltransferase